MAPESSNKHSPRMDDALKQPTDTRADEHRRWQGPDDASPNERQRRVDVDQHSPGAIEQESAETRSDLARYLEPSAFPGTKEEMVSAALREHAPDWVVDVLQRLPEGTTFANVEQLWEALGGRGEERRF